MTKAARAVDLEPIQRLEEKIRRLVGLVEQLRNERARAIEENQRLSREVETLSVRLSDVEGVSGEIASLREEREHVRARVAEMLAQLDDLDL